MPEAVTTELVVSMLRDLSVAFPARMGDAELMRRADIYRDNLTGFPGEALRWAAKQSIQEDKFFPKVARLRELAMRWQSANRVTVEARLEEPSGWCQGCKTVARVETRYRPRLDKNGRRILDERGRMWLESYARVRCLCDAPSRYQPDDDSSDHMTERRSA